MTIETLKTVSFICFILAIVFFLVTIALFFLLNIKKVFGDLSGITARKAIENIRNQTDSGAPRDFSLESKSNTAQISMSTKLKKSGSQGFAQTAKLATSKLRRQAEETTVLANSNGVAAETTVLSNTNNAAAETTVLTASQASETTVLHPSVQAVQETTVLTMPQTIGKTQPQPSVNVSAAHNSQPAVFVVDYEIWFTASKEIIR